MLKENKIAEDHNSNFPNVKYESKLGSAALQLQIPDWIAFKNQVQEIT